MRRTKIVATLGPASSDPKVILRMCKEGVNAFRLNFSHGTLEEKEEMVKAVRAVEAKLSGFIPIIGDLTGPTIRTGVVEEFEVRKGDKVRVVFTDKAENAIPVPYPRLLRVIEEDDVLLIDDGRLTLRVEEVSADSVVAVAINDGVVKSRRTFAIKGKEPPLPALTDKDRRDLEFCVKHGIEYVALSFVRTAEDVLALKDVLSELGAPEVKVIAKIETRSAVENLDRILKHSDAVIVARGDLGMFYPLEQIPELQNKIIKAARGRGRPVIVATQLLESMIENPMPTRSEVVDIMTAVREGVDALLLAGETSIGKYPVESVAWLKRIIEVAEEEPPMRVEGVDETIYDKFAKGIVLLAESLGAHIAAFTKKGNTALRLSRYRPRVCVYAFTRDVTVARQMSLLWGIEPFLAPEAEGEELWERIKEVLRCEGLVSYGDILIMMTGMRPGTTDLVRVETIKF